MVYGMVVCNGSKEGQRSPANANGGVGGWGEIVSERWTVQRKVSRQLYPGYHLLAVAGPSALKVAYGFQLPNSRSIFDQHAKPNCRYARRLTLVDLI